MSYEDAVMALEQRGQLGTVKEHQRQRKTAQEQRKTFVISLEEVKQAWQRVRAKGGIGGVDGQGIRDFERNLDKNLYKLWNRMSSGSYHPQAVLRVEIPKGDGKKRELGIPTIIDRVAQQVIRERFEPVVERFFHPDSYGFRPGKSPQQAVEKCRTRCWKYDWVLDVDIQKFFDTIDHELMMKAVEHHTTEKWMILYIRRWLTAPIQHRNGERETPERGTPQGGVISPLLANLYLHYTFDHWMTRKHPGVEFERYADDIIIHCVSEEQSEQIEKDLANRLTECGLTLHPEKTKIAYCKDWTRKGRYPTKKFTFLGYTFQPRGAKNQWTGKQFTRFLPAVSTVAQKKFRANVKKMRVLRMTNLALDELAVKLNPLIRGWYGYFSHFRRSALYRMNDWLDLLITRRLKRKFRLNRRKACAMLRRLVAQHPTRFAHWSLRFPGRAV
jgi:group II intron reverse transcriptase/maturase